MTAANINVQPIAHHIIMQLASWNVAPFTQAINSISYQALSTGWDWIKVLAKKQRGSKTTSCFSISGNHLNLSLWLYSPKQGYHALSIRLQCSSYCTKALLFSALRLLNIIQSATWNLSNCKSLQQRSQLNCLFGLLGVGGGVQGTPPKFFGHPTAKHEDNIIDPREKRPKQDVPPSAFFGADLTQESISAAMHAFATSLTQHRDEYQAAAGAASPQTGKESNSEELRCHRCNAPT